LISFNISITLKHTLKTPVTPFQTRPTPWHSHYTPHKIQVHIFDNGAFGWWWWMLTCISDIRLRLAILEPKFNTGNTVWVSIMADEMEVGSGGNGFPARDSCE
jgi:hypothetical protein